MATKTRFRSNTNRGRAAESQLRIALLAKQFRGRARMPYSRERRCDAASLKHARLHETPVRQFQHHIAVFELAHAVANRECGATSHAALCRLQDACSIFHVDGTSGRID